MKLPNPSLFEAYMLLLFAVACVFFLCLFWWERRKDRGGKPL